MISLLTPRPLALLALLALCVACVSEDGTSPERYESAFFQPDDAMASSEWSNSYSVAHTINGSGLPEGFGPADTHADYGGSNHWTTSDGDVEGAWATYSFNGPATMDTLYIWHHRSTMPPAYSDGYAITRFDVEFLDANGEQLLLLEDLAGEPELASAAVYEFEQVEGVRDVQITVRENNGDEQVTGIAEVAFGLTR
ncbi:hypothetical protein FRC98_01875 [Lujinxingia vulgaris]|uniref:Uncharacterized protein n=1 Tax=Lujinxingia vulgaris TaxID=2600176 RepID=A0A5C6XH21_9DELT|nr:hypothetical protein [Lujinxingia vulgaris]TXD39174.1 hypothetical protein FRC98_01875 [Lujinxingia vulgaris]